MTLTAGPDLSIGELDEVASTIGALASDDASIIVGAPIDSGNTSGELRVTLFETRLGKVVSVKKSSNPKPERTGKIDYSQLDKPIDADPVAKKLG